MFVEKTDIARKCQTRKRFIRFTFIYKPEMVNAYLFGMAKRVPGNIDVHIGPASTNLWGVAEEVCGYPQVTSEGL